MGNVKKRPSGKKVEERRAEFYCKKRGGVKKGGQIRTKYSFSKSKR